MAINFIYNEQLSGTVDGVNKVFTSTNQIDRIEDLRVGGADYSDFSFTGNTVTLSDAPTVALGAPYADYFVSGVTPAPTTSGKTFGTLISEIYDDIGQDENSPQYPRKMVVRYAKETIPIHENKRINPLRKIGRYSFNKSRDYNVTSYSATELELGQISTYVPASGAVLIRNGTFVKYASKSSTKLSSLSLLSIVYDANDRVDIGYQIPEGVQKVSEVFLEGVELDFKDSREFLTSYENCYTIIDGFLFLPRTLSDKVVTVQYVYPSVLPVSEDDVIDFQTNYEYVLRYDVLRRMYAQREDTRLSVTNELYKEAMGDYKNYISRQVNNINGTVPSSSYKKLSNRYYGNTRRYQ